MVYKIVVKDKELLQKIVTILCVFTVKLTVFIKFFEIFFVICRGFYSTVVNEVLMSLSLVYE